MSSSTRAIRTRPTNRIKTPHQTKVHGPFKQILLKMLCRSASSKVKGSSSVVKVGTKVRGIRLVDGDHDIDCKVPGIGQMGLKSQFVKKAAD